MLAIDLSITILLATALVFTIIEFGLSVYIATISYVVVPTAYTFGPNATDAEVEWRQWYPPAEVSYLVFCSTWTFLVVPIMIAVPFIRRRFSDRLMGIGTFVLTTVTMIFWFAGFIALACLYSGAVATGIFGALLAFAVLSWLVFVALVVLNFLTAFGVLKSARRGHHPIFQRQHRTTSTATTIAQPTAPVAAEKSVIADKPMESQVV